MKKLLILAIVVATSNALNAQEKEEKFNLEKGTWSISGQFSLSTNNITSDDIPDMENKRFAFSILPSASYFISDNLSLGLRLGYSNRGYDNSSSSNTNTFSFNSYSIAPHIKKHISISKQLAFSIQGELLYNYTEQESQSNSNTPTGSISNNYGINIRPGITYLIHKNLAFDANIGSIGYRSSDSKELNGNGNKTYDSSFMMDLSSNLFLGVTLFL